MSPIFASLLFLFLRALHWHLPHRVEVSGGGGKTLVVPVLLGYGVIELAELVDVSEAVVGGVDLLLTGVPALLGGGARGGGEEKRAQTVEVVEEEEQEQMCHGECGAAHEWTKSILTASSDRRRQWRLI